MKTNFLRNSFKGGEISQEFSATSNLELYPTAVERMENFIPTLQGSAKYRPPTVFLNEGFIDDFGFDDGTFTIPFNPADYNGLLLVFERGFFQAYNARGRMDSRITQTPTATGSIKTATNRFRLYYTADPIVSSGINGTYVEAILDVTNFDTSVVSRLKVRGDVVDQGSDGTGDWFEIFDPTKVGDPVNSTIEIISAHRLVGAYDFLGDFDYDPSKIDYVQIKNSIYLIRPSYANVIVYTFDGDNFTRTLETITVSYDPDYWGTKPDEAITFFTSIAFYEQRLVLGKEDVLYFSRTNRLTDFSINGEVTDSMAYTLAGVNNNVSDINWIQPTDSAIVVGTDTGSFIAMGGNEAAPITPNSISIRPIDNIGSKNAKPILTDKRIYFIERNDTTLRSMDYSKGVRGGYESFDMNQLSKDMAFQGIRKLAFVQKNTNITYAALENGGAIGVVTDRNQSMMSWFRLKLNQTDKVIDLGTIIDDEDGDVLMLVIDRPDKTTGENKRYIEKLDVERFYLRPEDFYITGSKATDLALYRSYILSQQENDLYLDSKTVFNPKIEAGSIDNVFDSFSQGGVTPNEGVLTVGDEIVEVGESGRAIVTGISGGVFDLNITSAFSKADYSFGELVAKRVSFQAPRFKDRTVIAATENKLFIVEVDSSGVLDLTNLYENQIDLSSFINFGLPYRGLIKTLPLQGYSKLGDSYFKEKNMSELHIKLENALGLKFGTDFYTLKPLNLRTPNDPIDSQIPLFTGVSESLSVEDDWEKEKSLYFVQDSPFPMTINSYGYYMKTEES